MLPALFASLVLLMARSKKGKRSLGSVVQIVGTQQTLSTLFFVFRYLWELPKMPKGIVLLPAVYLKKSPMCRRLLKTR
jgi:hypothetical protein